MVECLPSNTQGLGFDPYHYKKRYPESTSAIYQNLIIGGKNPCVIV